MNKFEKLYHFFKEIISKPALINLIINRNDAWIKKFRKKHHHISPLPQIDLQQISPKDKYHIPALTFLGGGSMPTDLLLLRLLCEKFDNCNYFEIGTWRGESAVNVIDVTSKCCTLNLSEKEMQTLNMKEAYINAQAFLSKNDKRITHLYGDSKTFDFEGVHQKFDVIFIDGNHHYDYVLSDTQKVFQHLVHEDSIVVWHDYAYNPEDVRFEVYKAILDGTPVNFHSNIYHVANTMCAVFYRANFKTTTLDSPVLPKKLFQVSIEVKDENSF